MATVEEKIAGLYIAFFNRAADQNGLIYWLTEAERLDEDTAIKTLASGFATHEKFTSLYGQLGNQAYVEAIYINTLGKAGDTEGVSYWINLLSSGMSRSDMVAEFVSAALDFDQNDPKFASLPQEDLDAAQARKDLLANKVEVALDFIDKLGNATNVTNLENIEEDDAYKASIKILSEVTQDKESVDVTLELNQLLSQNLDTALDTLNSMENIVQNNSVNGSVSIIGTLEVGGTLIADTLSLKDDDGIGSFSYQWKAGGVDIEGATDSSYQLSENEDGKRISVLVSYEDNRGFLESIESLDTTADGFDSVAISFNEDEISALEKNSVGYTVSGLDEDAVAEVRFMDSSFNALNVEISSNGSYSVDLSSLIGGSVVSFISVEDTAGNTASGSTDSLTVHDTTSLAKKNLSVGSLSSFSTEGVSSLASGNYWNVGSGGTVTYSFNLLRPSDYFSYGSDLTLGWKALNFEQKETVRTIFSRLEDIINIDFVEVVDTFSDSDGDIQFNIVAMDQYTEGFAFYPGEIVSYEGDVFLTSQFNSSPEEYGLSVGETGWGVMVHEIGHALGLEHSFEHDNTTLLSPSLDDVNHTVMSYTNNNMIYTFEYLETAISSSVFYEQTSMDPQLYSLMDVAALQYIYGANIEANLEDNHYTYSFTDYALHTIWDAGGEDTIDVSQGTGSSVIDLNPGSLNSVDQYTTAQIISMHQTQLLEDGDTFDDYIAQVISSADSSNLLYKGKDNLGIATGTIIENVKTGSGDDIITDNAVDNIIQTFLGNDTIYLGNGGFDTIDGGEGDDTIYFNTTADEVLYMKEKSDGSYDLLTDEFAVNFIGIETLHFTDTIWEVA